MSFHEVQFPVDISYGSRGGPGYNTVIIESEGGVEQRVARMSSARRVYDARYGIKTIEQVQTIQDFYLCRYGCSYGFRYKDHLDYSTADNHRGIPAYDDQLLGTGNGTNTLFQLRKYYTSGGYQVVRNITKPVTGTVKVSVNNIELTSGFSVDDTTGVVTISPAPGLGLAVKGGCYFDVPVRFGKEIDEGLQISIDDFENGNIPSIPMKEIMDGVPVPRVTSEPGGSVEICPLVAPTLNLSARVWVIDTTNVATCYLPDKSLVPIGGPVFYIINIGPSTLVVKESDHTTTLISIAAGDGAEIVLTQDYLGNLIWYAF